MLRKYSSAVCILLLFGFLGACNSSVQEETVNAIDDSIPPVSAVKDSLAVVSKEAADLPGDSLPLNERNLRSCKWLDESSINPKVYKLLWNKKLLLTTFDGGEIKYTPGTWHLKQDTLILCVNADSSCYVLRKLSSRRLESTKIAFGNAGSEERAEERVFLKVEDGKDNLSPEDLYGDWAMGESYQFKKDSVRYYDPNCQEDVPGTWKLEGKELNLYYSELSCKHISYPSNFKIREATNRYLILVDRAGQITWLMKNSL